MLKISDNAIKYTVQQLFHIAGVAIKSDSIKVTRHIEYSEVKVELSQSSDIVFRLLTETETEKLIKGELRSERIRSFDSKIDVPVVFPEQHYEFAAICSNTLVINADIITLSFIMLSRNEEVLTRERDRHDRFEYKNSIASKYDIIDIPVVDEYSMLLRMWLLRFIPDLEITRQKGEVIPAHDIDFLLRFGSLFKNIKTIVGGDLLARKSLPIAYRSILECIAASKETKNDHLILAIKRLMEISSEAGLCSGFYFKGLKKGQRDCTYDVFSPEVRYCLDFITDAGMQVGMHAGYSSYNNDSNFKREKEAIESVFGRSVTRCRQHYLRFDINQTLKIWQDNRILHDSTLGYAEREGFRCGTCHTYYLYDLKNDTVSTVQESPLIVMEGTLFQYRGMNSADALFTLNKLYHRCRAVEGDFVILWHNHNVFRDYLERFQNVYCKFIEGLSE